MNESTNPHVEWLHECHNCSNSFITNGNVDDGIPYDILMEYGKYFVEEGLFEKNFAEGLSHHD